MKREIYELKDGAASISMGLDIFGNPGWHHDDPANANSGD
jgi:hypothetical protein